MGIQRINGRFEAKIIACWGSDCLVEISFLLSLYALDKKPENRIATQYLTVKDKNMLKTMFYSS
uniref:DUF6688 domain-containing protein n=1 Tax=Flammeovirga aprica TaxID=29528 RepID=UPI0037420E22